MTDLEKDLAICDAATDGPWTISKHWSDDMKVYIDALKHCALAEVVITTTDGYCSKYADNNAEFIAHFNPQKVRQMLTYIKEMEETIDAITGGE